jgi:hypothetical protein
MEKFASSTQMPKTVVENIKKFDTALRGCGAPFG